MFRIETVISGKQKWYPMRLRVIVANFLSLIFLANCGGPDTFEQEYNQKIKNDLPVSVNIITAHKPNYAGGVDIYIQTKNLSSKTIKYINWTAVPYNAVGDKQTGEIRKRTSVILEEVGPLEYLEKTKPGMGWEAVWYNHSIQCIELVKLSIEYMDGTKKHYNGKNAIKPLLRSDVTNDCTI